MSLVTRFLCIFDKRSLFLYGGPYFLQGGTFWEGAIFCKAQAVGGIPLTVSMSSSKTKQTLVTRRRRDRRRLGQDGVREASMPLCSNQVTGELTGSCALLRVNTPPTPHEGYHFWHLRGVSTQTHRMTDRAGLKTFTNEVMCLGHGRLL